MPALGSWMMLPNLTDERTRTVLPMNDSLYGAAQVELDRLGPMVIGVPGAPAGSPLLVDRVVRRVHELRCPSRAEVDGRAGPANTSWLTEWDAQAPSWAVGVLRSPTVSVLLLNRVLVGYEPGDIDVVAGGVTA